MLGLELRASEYLPPGVAVLMDNAGQLIGILKLEPNGFRFEGINKASFEHATKMLVSHAYYLEMAQSFCGAAANETETCRNSDADTDFTCTLPKGHEGEHIAGGPTGIVYRRWPNV